MRDHHVYLRDPAHGYLPLLLARVVSNCGTMNNSVCIYRTDRHSREHHESSFP